MKRPETVLKEYCQKLNDENLKWISNRLSQRLGGDVGDVLEFVGNNRELDRLLQAAPDSISVYDMVDALAAAVQKESEKRSVVNA